MRVKAFEESKIIDNEDESENKNANEYTMKNGRVRITYLKILNVHEDQ